MMKCLTFIFTLVFLSGLFTTGQAQKPVKKTIKIKNETRHYQIVVPKSVPTKNRSLVIGLHGGGGNSSGMQIPMRAFSEKFGFVQFYPDAIKGSWNVGGLPTANNQQPTADDLGFLSSLIDEAVKNYQVDPDRVFLVGASRGAMFATYAMTKMPEKITAVAAFIGSMPNIHQDFTLTDKVGLLVVNGTEDPLIPYNGGLSKAGKPNNKVNNEKGAVMPTEAFVKKVALLNGADQNPVKSEMPDKNTKDGCQVEVYTYNNKDPKGRVTLIKVIGGGHTIPGGGQYLPESVIGKVCKDFLGYEEMYKFFISFN